MDGSYSDPTSRHASAPPTPVSDGVDEDHFFGAAGRDGDNAQSCCAAITLPPATVKGVYKVNAAVRSTLGDMCVVRVVVLRVCACVHAAQRPGTGCTQIWPNVSRRFYHMHRAPTGTVCTSQRASY